MADDRDYDAHEGNDSGVKWVFEEESQHANYDEDQSESLNVVFCSPTYHKNSRYATPYLNLGI